MWLKASYETSMKHQFNKCKESENYNAEINYSIYVVPRTKLTSNSVYLMLGGTSKLS